MLGEELYAHGMRLVRCVCLLSTTEVPNLGYMYSRGTFAYLKGTIRG